jgi:hypothetical protein
MEKVPICIGFGGVHNYGYVVPTATTNTGVRGYTGKEDGDYCLIQFIGGSWLNPVITSIWPNPLNRKDPPSVTDGGIAFARVSGTELLIDSEGDLLLDARGANAEVVVDSQSGNYVRKPASGENGSITVVTRNDIYVAAGYPNDNEAAGTLPGGTAVIQASKDVEMFSTLKSVKIYSTRESKDDDGNLTRVDVQGPRGSLRPAARKNDRVKITSGDSGDLFAYIQKMHTYIEGVGSLLSGASDPGVAAAGELLSSFTSSNPAPTNQTGKIITGSDYCYIASEGDASDIGEDENGIKDSAGNPISPETLDDFKTTCIASAAASVVAEAVAAPLQGEILSQVTKGLKTAEKALEKIPGGQPAAIAIGLAIPPLLGIMGELFSTSPETEMKDINLPSGANMEDLVGGDGSGGLAGEMSTISTELDMLRDIKDYLKTSWDFYNLDPTEDNAAKIPLNPLRQADPTIIADHAEPTIPPGPVVKNSGYWYLYADLSDPDPSSKYYDKTAISSRQSKMKTKGEEVESSVDGMSFVSPAAVKIIELGTGLTDAEGSGDYSKVDDLTGGTIKQSANTCIDKKISEA